MFRASAALLAVVVAVSGCTSVVAGVATRATHSMTSDGVDLDQLETGNYPTEAAPAYGSAGTEDAGRLLEGARLANNVVVPTDVDASLVDIGENATTIVARADRLDDVIAGPYKMPNEMAAVAGRHNFVVGFSSGRATTEQPRTTLVNAVLVFLDEPAAAAAATEMSAASLRAFPDNPTTLLPIPRHDSTIGFIADFDGTLELGAYTAHGRYVLYQRSNAPTPEAAADLLARNLDLQIPLIDEFEPTDPSKFADLPIDPTGLLALTILVDDNDATINENIVFDAAAARHFQSSPVRSAALFDQVKLQTLTRGLTTVYLSSSEDGGARMVEAFADEVENQWHYTPAAGVAGMEEARCFSQTTTTYTGDDYSIYYCAGSAGKYAFEAIGPQEPDVHQMMGAQYTILATG